MDAWRHFLRAHCAVTKTLDAELMAAHGLGLSGYEVLIQLDAAEDGALRMSEVADHALLTRSGMTRLVTRLEQDGLVERQICEADRRVMFARLTAVGKERLAEARETHHAGIRRVFADHFAEAEAAQLAQLLGRLVPGDFFGGCGASESTAACGE
jgi:DNA-binding MarR family transcriptional regulator